MALAPLSAVFQSLPSLPTIKLGSSGADSHVGGLLHTLGTCGSLQLTLLWGWEFPLLLPQPHGCFQSEVWGFISPHWSPGLPGLFAPPLFLLVYLCSNVGPQGLLAAAWPAPFHSPPPCCKSSGPWLSVSAPPTGLDECFFFISLVVGLPYSSIFCQFWLCFVFKLLSFFWLCEEAQCVYLRLHLGRKPLLILFFNVFKAIHFSRSRFYRTQQFSIVIFSLWKYV